MILSATPPANSLGTLKKMSLAVSGSVLAWRQHSLSPWQPRPVSNALNSPAYPPSFKLTSPQGLSLALLLHSTRNILWVSRPITPPPSIRARLILPSPLISCLRAGSCTWRGLASCLVAPLEAEGGGDDHQADLATSPQHRTQLPSWRRNSLQ